MVAAVAVAVPAGATAAEVRPVAATRSGWMDTDDVDPRVRDRFFGPHAYRCEERGGVTYCAYPEYVPWIPLWEEAVAPVVRAIPPERRHLVPQVRQMTSAWFFGEDTEAHAVRPGMSWGHPDQRRRLAEDLSLHVAGLRLPCDARGQARTLVTLWLIGQASPVTRPRSLRIDGRLSGKSLVDYGDIEVGYARRLLASPGARERVRTHWDTLMRPTTTLERALPLLGLDREFPHLETGGHAMSLTIGARETEERQTEEREAEGHRTEGRERARWTAGSDAPPASAGEPGTRRTPAALILAAARRTRAVLILARTRRTPASLILAGARRTRAVLALTGGQRIRAALALTWPLARAIDWAPLAAVAVFTAALVSLVEMGSELSAGTALDLMRVGGALLGGAAAFALVDPVATNAGPAPVPRWVRQGLRCLLAGARRDGRLAGRLRRRRLPPSPRSAVPALRSARRGRRVPGGRARRRGDRHPVHLGKTARPRRRRGPAHARPGHRAPARRAPAVAADVRVRPLVRGASLLAGHVAAPAAVAGGGEQGRPLTADPSAKGRHEVRPAPEPNP
ncbi:hypothetical protein [Streptosporangium vulgare]|uniref:hypothetical protein n=1 Tax=Streptosporangium vulgare TaxID=46190 RepID=UPI0031D0A231